MVGLQPIVIASRASPPLHEQRIVDACRPSRDDSRKRARAVLAICNMHVKAMLRACLTLLDLKSRKRARGVKVDASEM